MSDTPRTDAVWERFGTEENLEPDVEFSALARQLERELNATNDRIKRLFAVANDPSALWVNWLRGDVKLPEGIGDVRQYQERITRLEIALFRITNQDHRGNRSTESQIAFEALKEAKL